MKATSVSSIDAKTRVAGACIGFVSNVDYREDMTPVEHVWVYPLTTQRNSRQQRRELRWQLPAIAIAVGKDARRICLGVSKQVFTEMFNGCRDLSSLRPDKIGVTICQWLKLD